MCKIHGGQSVKWHEKIKYNLYINDVFILFMMSWCEVHMIYILIKSMQLSSYNYAYNYAIFMH
jgi:hypothetical protein